MGSTFGGLRKVRCAWREKVTRRLFGHLCSLTQSHARSKGTCPNQLSISPPHQFTMSDNDLRKCISQRCKGQRRTAQPTAKDSLSSNTCGGRAP